MQFKYRFIYAILALLLVSQASIARPEGWPDLQVLASDGAPFTSRSLDGQVTVVTIWASWCSNSRRQLPILTRLQDRYADQDLKVVGFSFDRSEEEHSGYVEHLDLNFPAIFARRGTGLEIVKRIQDRAGPLQAVPTLLVYDRDGKLVFCSVGFFHMSKLEKLVAPLLER